MAGALGGVRASALVCRVREAANMEATQSGSSQFVTDKEIRRRIDEAAAALYDKLIAAIGEDYFVKIVHLVHPPGVDVVQLPVDFYRLISVHTETADVTDAGTTYRDARSVEPFQRAEMTRLLALLPSDSGERWYRLRGRLEKGFVNANVESSLTDFLEIVPQRVTTGSLRVAYLPRHSTARELVFDEIEGKDVLHTDHDPIYPGVSGWEEWIVLKVAIRLLAKEESDTSDLRADLAEVDARISAAAGRRDEGRPERMVDLKYQDALDPSWDRRGGW